MARETDIQNLQRQLDDLRNKIRFQERLEGGSGDGPACLVYHNSNQPVANNTDVRLTWNSEVYDTDALHSTTTNPERITIGKAGLYLVELMAEWDNNSSGSRYISVKLNNTNYIGRDGRGASLLSNVSLVFKYPFAVDDYIETWAYQTSGGTRNVVRTADCSPYFGVTYLRSTPS